MNSLSENITSLVVYILVIIITTYIANRKGKSTVLWFFLALFFNLIVLIVIIFKRSEYDYEYNDNSYSQKEDRCVHCGAALSYITNPEYKEHIRRNPGTPFKGHYKILACPNCNS